MSGHQGRGRETGTEGRTQNTRRVGRIMSSIDMLYVARAWGCEEGGLPGVQPPRKEGLMGCHWGRL